MRIAIPLYDRFTALDAVGPYEVVQRLPGAELTWLAAEPGPVRTDTGKLGLIADARFEDLPDPEVLIVPGGTGTDDVLDDERLVGWIRRAHETSQWTTSVCTGSLLLGAAGVLDGLEATSPLARPRRAGALRGPPDRAARRRAGQGDHRRRRVVGHRHGACAGRADRRRRRSRRRSSSASSTTPSRPSTPARRTRRPRRSSSSCGASLGPRPADRRARRTQRSDPGCDPDRPRAARTAAARAPARRRRRGRGSAGGRARAAAGAQAPRALGCARVARHRRGRLRRARGRRPAARAAPVVGGADARLPGAHRRSATAAPHRSTARPAPINAWVRLYPELALPRARAADRRLARGAAPLLCGIPIGVKDLYSDLAALPLTASSRVLDG